MTDDFGVEETPKRTSRPYFSSMTCYSSSFFFIRMSSPWICTTLKCRYSEPIQCSQMLPVLKTEWTLYFIVLVHPQKHRPRSFSLSFQEPKVEVPSLAGPTTPGEGGELLFLANPPTFKLHRSLTSESPESARCRWPVRQW